MLLSDHEVKKIAELAKFNLTDNEIHSYAETLSGIFNLIDHLTEVNMDDVTPMAHPLSISQRLRADVATEHNQRDQFQQNAASVEAGLYLVPQVIE